ncbi:TIGR00730 family Rossman fold protein [Agrobacterium tumefaciens]|uniref:Cytokinin riboside 5'-monophosphate phosphoribohydrolase n=3 Tax=Rhizobium/Agrobacterium group TaxID=227290 RepID=A0A2Z2PMU4_RHIRH|nr:MULTISPECIES: TIGR00730 family Rossman fold protein [Rhizobium/Agrobacterium group]ASK42932.1 Rossman fold protein, TIGR00730 family [Rhizobium rhizogenes]MCZ7977735.1 TIGR00730 family Rossman fold protein [Agrobacterium salinitolerans]MDA5250307.1 TIGR00730 family Rossman fold protein [Agrobacterium sp. MAFF210268]TRA98530.1 TIGR00730 family Rossman fold protein [Agrobacterium tumefaciens]TRB16556.1 TIGR00730 family Rossman fold protein [Agrobacterium tumefaciens]
MRYCVFAGSSNGQNPAYVSAANQLGKAMARSGIGLVYGGASIGLMGAIADAARSDGGEVIGVIPRALAEKEIAHTDLADLRVVETMHERKALMAALSDGFIALPGGLGTLEELFEVWTWAQLGYHNKPCALLDIAGFYKRLDSFLDHVVGEAFLTASHRNILLVEEDAEVLISAMANDSATLKSRSEESDFRRLRR